MNPLTLVKRIQNINAKEAALGISDDASWHAKYKDSAYVFVGGLPFDLTEGDLLAVFAQYGEIVDVNLVRDKGTGKSKGFAFIAYEDQRSTNLAVDNLNGAQILGRVIRVDHVSNYKKKEEEDEETARQKREERGVCRAFQRGECTRGAGCKFSHDEQRAADTGWGAEEDRHSRWTHDKHRGSTGKDRRSSQPGPLPDVSDEEARPTKRDSRHTAARDNDIDREMHQKSHELYSRDSGSRNAEKHRDQKKDVSYKEGWERLSSDKSKRHDLEPKPKEDRPKRDEKRPRQYESESYGREDRGPREGDRRAHDRGSSLFNGRRMDEDRRQRSHR